MNSDRSRLRLAPLAAALAAAAALSACRGGADSSAAPDFSLAAREGGTVTLSSRKGKPVLLNFWATWCDSCKEELPALNELQRASARDGFDLLAISVDDDPPKQVPPFVSATGFAAPILYGDRKVQDAYMVRMLPTTYLIAPDGTVARRYSGPLDARAVENDILSLLRRPS